MPISTRRRASARRRRANRRRRPRLRRDAAVRRSRRLPGPARSAGFLAGTDRRKDRCEFLARAGGAASREESVRDRRARLRHVEGARRRHGRADRRRRYTITDEDVKGPFEKIPPKLADQAKLPALGYQSADGAARRAVSRVAGAADADESRRADGPPARRSRCPRSRRSIPNAKPVHDAASRRRHDPGVARRTSALRATRADGTLVFFAPGVERQHPRSAAAGRLEGDRRRLASGVPLQPRPVLGRQAEGREGRRSSPARTTRWV